MSPKEPDQPRTSVHFDEEAMARDDLLRGSRMPIDEAPTPFLRSPRATSDDEIDPVPHSSPEIHEAELERNLDGLVERLERLSNERGDTLPNTLPPTLPYSLPNQLLPNPLPNILPSTFLPNSFFPNSLPSSFLPNSLPSSLPTTLPTQLLHNTLPNALLPNTLPNTLPNATSTKPDGDKAEANSRQVEFRAKRAAHYNEGSVTLFGKILFTYK